MSINQAYTKCPKCEAEYEFLHFSVKNESGVEIWSDGFGMASMRRDIIAFAKCPACDTFFWLKKNTVSEATDSVTLKKIDNSWSLDNIGRKEIDFVKDALKSSLANTSKKEIY